MAASQVRAQACKLCMLQVPGDTSVNEATMRQTVASSVLRHVDRSEPKVLSCQNQVSVSHSITQRQANPGPLVAVGVGLTFQRDQFCLSRGCGPACQRDLGALSATAASYSSYFSMTINVKFPPGSSVKLGTPVKNTATIKGTQHGTGKAMSESDSANVTVNDWSGGAITSSLTKYASVYSYNSVVIDGSTVGWSVNLQNTSPVAVQGQINDIDIPDGLELVSVYTSRLAGSKATVTYLDGATSSDLDLSCPSGDRSYVPIPASDVSSHGRATSIVFEYPSILGGQSVSASLQTKVTAAKLANKSGPGPWPVQNCATGATTRGDLTSKAGKSCATVNVMPTDTPLLSVYKYTNDGDLIPGEAFTWQLQVSNTSADSTWTPKIVDLLPTTAEYVTDSFALTKASSDAACPTDFAESIGKPTSSTWSDRQQVAWTSETLVKGKVNCLYTYQTTVKPGTAKGTYSGTGGNQAYLFDAKRSLKAGGTMYPDSYDLNGGGHKDDGTSYNFGQFNVVDHTALWIEKKSSGNLNVTSGERDWFGSSEPAGQEDQVSTVSPGGKLLYEVTVGNLGNRNLTTVVAYDLLPYPKNPGVTTVRVDDQPQEGGNQWVPALTGPVTAPKDAPETLHITYSTKTAPCRPEMENSTAPDPAVGCSGKQDTSWMTADEVDSSGTAWSEIRVGDG